MLRKPLRTAAAVLALTAAAWLSANSRTPAHAQTPIPEFEAAPLTPAPPASAASAATDADGVAGCGENCNGGEACCGKHGRHCGKHGCHHCGGYAGVPGHKFRHGIPMYSRDLFYNYYVGPAAAPGPTGANAVAAMYPSPLPTPLYVGHTYITYQPLLPHEFLYAHKHWYRSAYPGGGVVTTKVHYNTSFAGHWNPWFGNRPPRPRGPEYLRDPLAR